MKKDTRDTLICGGIIGASILISLFVYYTWTQPQLNRNALQLNGKPEDKKIEIVDDEKLQQLQREEWTIYIAPDGQSGYTLVPIDDRLMPKKFKKYVESYLKGREGR